MVLCIFGACPLCWLPTGPLGWLSCFIPIGLALCAFSLYAPLDNYLFRFFLFPMIPLLFCDKARTKPVERKWAQNPGGPLVPLIPSGKRQPGSLCFYLTPGETPIPMCFANSQIQFLRPFMNPQSALFSLFWNPQSPFCYPLYFVHPLRFERLGVWDGRSGLLQNALGACGVIPSFRLVQLVLLDGFLLDFVLGGVLCTGTMVLQIHCVKVIQLCAHVSFMDPCPWLCHCVL